MYDTKFVNIFLQLNRKEKQNLKLWVHSPIGNTRDDVKELFNYLFQKRTIQPQHISREEAYTHLYPGKKYDDKKMRYAMSFALQSMENFLVFYHHQQQEFQKELVLCSIYHQKNAGIYAQQQLGKASEKLAASRYRNNEFYRKRFHFSAQEYVLQSTNRRDENFNLQEISNQLHIYFISELLKYTCIALSYQQVSGKTFRFPLLDTCLQQIEKGVYDDIIPIKIYYLCYLLSTNGNEASFRQLQLLLKEYEHQFPESELKDIYLLAINFCIQEMNAGNEQFARYAYDMYLYALEKKILLENGELSRFTFKNIAFIGIKKLKAYKSVEKFIETYKNAIPAAYRENTVLFNKATLFFAQKEYKKAVLILQQVEFKDILWNLDAKSMLLKMYFEEKDFEAMLSLAKSYTLFINRQKNLGMYASRYKKVIRYMMKLYKHTGSPAGKRKLLESELLQEKELPEKEWFLQQVRKL